MLRGVERFEDDAALIVGLRAGDETAFGFLIDRYDTLLRRIARGYVASDEVAADVVQDTWIAVLRGIDRFEGRASLKTWLIRILMNIARTRGAKEARTRPFSSLGSDDEDRAIDAERFVSALDGALGGHWTSAPSDWQRAPEEELLSAETLALVALAVAELPEQQMTVIQLRDIAGWSSAEVCNALDISETNQRVLLHRARAKVRRALETYFEGER